MQKTIVPLFLAGFLSLLALPQEASADPPSNGFTLEFGFGGNLLTDDSYVAIEDGIHAELKPMVGMHLGFLGRINRFVSLGFLAHYGFAYAQSPYLRHEFADMLAALIEIRVHIGIGIVEPWFGVGVGYAMTHFLGETSGVRKIDRGMMLHGTGIDVAFGLNIFVNRHLAVGPFFRAVFGIWPAVCERTDTDRECERVREHYGERFDDLPHMITFGFFASNTF